MFALLSQKITASSGRSFLIRESYKSKLPLSKELFLKFHKDHKFTHFEHYSGLKKAFYCFKIEKFSNKSVGLAN